MQIKTGPDACEQQAACKNRVLKTQDHPTLLIAIHGANHVTLANVASGRKYRSHPVISGPTPPAYQDKNTPLYPKLSVSIGKFSYARWLVLLEP